MRDKSGRRFSEWTGNRYRQMWRKYSSLYKTTNWTEGIYEINPRDTHPKVAERAARYTAEKGNPRAAADAVKIALDRPDVADLVVADDDTNRNVTHARHRHDTERVAVGETVDPERREARHNTEQRDVIYRLVKFRNWLFTTTDEVQQWEWTDELRAEFTDALDGVTGAIDGFKVAPDMDNQLAVLLQGEST